jgi:hypothetical protein
MGRQLEQVGRDKRIVSSLNKAGVSREVRRAQHRWRRHAARQRLHQGADDIGGEPKYKGWYA